MQDVDLIYIYLSASYTRNSVQDKIIAQLAAMNESGIKAYGLFFTTGKNQNSEPKFNTNFDYIHVESNIKGWFRSLRENRLMLKSMVKHLEKTSINSSFIYIRSHRPTYTWFKFIRKYSDKLIVEHQTIEKDELRNLSKKHKFALKPSTLLSWLEFSFIPKFQEFIWGSLSVGQCKKIVGVTDEITKYEISRALFSKPKGNTITNGIIVENFKLRKTPNFDGKELHLLMLVGGTTDVDWHGIDLLLEGIENYRGLCQIKLHLAGHSNILEIYNSNYLVKYGYLNGLEIDNLCDSCHLAVGTFAFARKGLNEATTLKMREYAARGIPAVYGHIDTDYIGLEQKNLALRFEAMKPPSFDNIIKFASIVNETDIAKQIRYEAIEKMSMNSKMKKLKGILV